MDRHNSTRCQHCDGMGKVVSVDSDSSSTVSTNNGRVTSVWWPVKKRTLECRDCGERWVKS